MFRRCRLIALILVATFSAVPVAYGTDNWYFAGRGGYVSDSGFGVAGAIGRQWVWPAPYAANIRGELEIALLRNETDNSAIGYVSTLPEMANVYYDFHTTVPELFPFVGAGLGVVSADNGNDTDQAASYQGIVGIRWRIHRSTFMPAEYRYVTAPGLNFQVGNSGTSAPTNYTTHNLFLGVGFKF